MTATTTLEPATTSERPAPATEPASAAEPELVRLIRPYSWRFAAVVTLGTHAELLRRDGRYADFWKASLGLGPGEGDQPVSQIPWPGKG